MSFAADDPLSQEDACPEDSNCPSECYCEGGTVDCSHRELKGKTIGTPTHTRKNSTVVIVKTHTPSYEKWQCVERFFAIYLFFHCF